VEELQHQAVRNGAVKYVLFLLAGCPVWSAAAPLPLPSLRYTSLHTPLPHPTTAASSQPARLLPPPLPFPTALFA
jgi:hypothetical protein